jgi:hypothetical protein
VGYCRSVVRSGGRVRLAGVLQPMVSESLGRAELFDLFEPSADAGPAIQKIRIGAPAGTRPIDQAAW